MNIFKRDFLAYTANACFFIFFLLVMIPFAVEPPIPGIGESHTSPSTWPTFCTLALIGLSGILAFDALKKWKNSPAGPVPEKIAWKHFWIAIGVFFLYFYCIQILGLTLASAVFSGIYVYLCGARSATMIAVVALVIPVFLYLFFFYVARVSMPMSPFGII